MSSCDVSRKNAMAILPAALLLAALFLSLSAQAVHHGEPARHTDVHAITYYEDTTNHVVVLK